MHYSVPIIVAALAAPLISAQSLSDFPPCAQTCNKIAQRVKPCDFDDLNCICKEPDYITTVAQCEQNTCDPTGVTEEQTLARRKCAPVGIATEDVNVINPKDILNGDDVFPKCAQDCISQASAATGVDIKDYKSLCFNNRGVLDTLQTCQRANCSQAEYNQANTFGAQLCSFVPGSPGYGDPSVNRTQYTTNNLFSQQALCSQAPAAQALLNSTCRPDDYACICRAPSLLDPALTNAERENCNAFDYLLLVVETFQACKNVGVDLTSQNQTTATNTTTNGTISTTTGTPPPARFTGAAAALTRSWEVASLIAAVGIAALWL